MFHHRILSTLMLSTTFFCVGWSPFHAATTSGSEPIRAGIIGCDTSHVLAFTKVINDPNASGPLADVQVVAAYPGGSPDIPSSWNRVEQYTQELRAMDITIVDSIEALLEQVDVVLLESVDGRPHLEQARPVLNAGKPLFIDKPLAGSLSDAIEIFELAKEQKTPCFSSSSLRFSAEIQRARTDPDLGAILGCVAHSPCSLEPHHPDLFWYGVHGVEILYTIMGPGCERVTRVSTDGTDEVVGIWRDGRIGTFRGTRTGSHRYGALVFGEKSVAYLGKYDGYQPLVIEIARFFKTGKPPVPNDETLEIFAFMTAADASKRHDGAAVTIESVWTQARAEVEARRAIASPPKEAL